MKLLQHLPKCIQQDLGGDYMTSVVRDEILSCFILSFINYILRLHVKSFIPTRRDPALPERNFPMQLLQPA